MSSTIDDFSEQWSAFNQNREFFASEELLVDHFGPLLKLTDIASQRIAEVGSGNGRFIKIFAKYAREVVAIEPSAAIKVSRAYTKELNNIQYVNSDVYSLPLLNPFDYIFCIGVLHHTADPLKTLNIIRLHLVPGGRAVIWVYGREGNGLYLFFSKLLRLFTTRVPHRFLMLVAALLLYPLKAYIFLCKYLPLPLRNYMLQVLGKCDSYTQKMNIYDQLNPRIAYYWRREEFEALLKEAGFVDIKLYHRHGYSWTALVSA